MLRKICIGGLLLAGATSSAWGAINLTAAGGNGSVSLSWSAALLQCGHSHAQAAMLW